MLYVAFRLRDESLGCLSSRSAVSLEPSPIEVRDLTKALKKVVRVVRMRRGKHYADTLT